jgi:hypothetical protein
MWCRIRQIFSWLLLLGALVLLLLQLTGAGDRLGFYFRRSICNKYLSISY